MAHKLDYKLASPAQIAADLGETFARNRLARNITQMDLAREAGVSARTVKRFEAGEGATLETLIRLLQALDLEDHLQALLPDPAVQPVDVVLSGSSQKRQRQRARPRPKQDEKAPWTWGDEKP